MNANLSNWMNAAPPEPIAESFGESRAAVDASAALLSSLVTGVAE